MLWYLLRINLLDILLRILLIWLMWTLVDLRYDLILLICTCSLYLYFHFRSLDLGKLVIALLPLDNGGGVDLHYVILWCVFLYHSFSLPKGSRLIIQSFQGRCGCLRLLLYLGLWLYRLRPLGICFFSVTDINTLPLLILLYINTDYENNVPLIREIKLNFSSL